MSKIRYRKIEDAFAKLDTTNILDSELTNIFFPTNAYLKTNSCSLQHIVGPPGSGKSMILRKLSATCAGIRPSDIAFVGLFLSLKTNTDLISDLPYTEEIQRRISTNIAFLEICKKLFELSNYTFLRKQGWPPNGILTKPILANFLPENSTEAVKNKINNILNCSDKQFLKESEILQRINILDDLFLKHFSKHLSILIDDFGECKQTAQEGLSIFFQKGIQWACKASLRWQTYNVRNVNSPFEPPELGRKVEIIYIDDPQIPEAEFSKTLLKIASKRLVAYQQNNPFDRKGMETNIEKWFSRTKSSEDLNYCLKLVESRIDQFLFLINQMFSFADIRGSVSPPLPPDALEFAIASTLQRQRSYLGTIHGESDISKLLKSLRTAVNKSRIPLFPKTILLDRPLHLLHHSFVDSVKTGISKGIFSSRSVPVGIENLESFNVARLVLKCYGMEFNQIQDGKLRLSERDINLIYSKQIFSRKSKTQKNKIRIILSTKWTKVHSSAQAERTNISQVVDDLAKSFGDTVSIVLKENSEIYSISEKWYKEFMRLFIRRKEEQGEKIVSLVNITYPSQSIFMELGICCAKSNIIYLLSNPEIEGKSGESDLPGFIRKATGKLFTNFTISQLNRQLEDIINKIITGKPEGLPLPYSRQMASFAGKNVLNLQIFSGAHESINDDLGRNLLVQKINLRGQKLNPKVVCLGIRSLGSQDWSQIKNHAYHALNADVLLINFGSGDAIRKECAFLAGFSIAKRKPLVILSAPREHEEVIDFWWDDKFLWANTDELLENLFLRIQNVPFQHSLF